MNTVLEIKPAEIVIRKLALDALEKANGDVIKATKIMERDVLQHENKYRALMDPLVSNACYTAICSAQRTQRAVIWTAPNYAAGGNGARVHVLAAGNLLMFPLPGGQALGEADKEDVLSAAEFYSKQAENMSFKARWLMRIAESLTGKKIVKKVFTEDSLRKLQAEVQNA